MSNGGEMAYWGVWWRVGQLQAVNLGRRPAFFAMFVLQGMGAVAAAMRLCTA
jgi:hypothetical protein